MSWRTDLYAALADNDFVEAYRIMGYEDGRQRLDYDYLVPNQYLEAYKHGQAQRRAEVAQIRALHQEEWEEEVTRGEHRE
jgi:hypothetical protein